MQPALQGSQTPTGQIPVVALDQQMLQLSPLDAFKHKGRYLHAQLKKGQLNSSPITHVDLSSIGSETGIGHDVNRKLRDWSNGAMNATAGELQTQSSDTNRIHNEDKHTLPHNITSKQSLRAAGIINPMDISTQNSYHDENILANLSLITRPIKSPPSKIHSPGLPFSSLSAQSNRRTSLESQGSRYSTTQDPTRSMLQVKSFNIPSSATGLRAPFIERSSIEIQSSTSIGGIDRMEHHVSSPEGSLRDQRSPLTGSQAPGNGSSVQSSSPSSLARRTPQMSPLEFSKPSLLRSGSKLRSFSKTEVASLPDAALSAETHVELGIEQHEDNRLPQSTHHFKVAAEMGDLTGCLLYGLALRHGWGVRPDLKRSVQMLQRAADSVNLNSNNLRSSKFFTTPLNDQLAVAIYELAISFKNGWGVDMDKKTSLRYLELASDLGDVEAMVETADCYLQGIGCKKDKTKAAKLLRLAEGKGKKEIGNSWIWKSKYDD